VVRRYRVIVGKTEKPSPTLTAEITSVNLNRPGLSRHDRENRNIGAYAERIPLTFAHAHGRTRCARQSDRSNSVDWSGTRTPNFTVRQQKWRVQCARCGEIDMPNPYSVYMHEPTSAICSATTTVRFPRLLAVDNVRDLATCFGKRRSEMESRRADAAIATGQRQDIALPNKVPVGLDLSHGMDDQGPDDPVPQRHLRPDEQLLEPPPRKRPSSTRRGNLR